jgi:hypothetical protein
MWYKLYKTLSIAYIAHVQLFVCTVFTLLPPHVCRPNNAAKDNAPLGLKFGVLPNDGQVQVPAVRTGFMFDSLDTNILPHEVNDSDSEQHDRVITADSARFVTASGAADDDAGSVHSYQDEDVQDNDDQESQVCALYSINILFLSYTLDSTHNALH